MNSPFAELGTLFLDEHTVVYASSKKTDEDQAFIKTRRKRQRQLFIAIYKGSLSEDGDIVDQGRFFNQTQKHIQLADFAITPDGKSIFFTWNNYHPYMIDTIENYWSNLRIMKGTINADNEIDIPNAHPLPFINTRNNFNHVALSSDGKTLYFSADLPKGAGGMDIYKVTILPDGTYSEPLNLGREVNSSQDELFPFIDASNNLYFASYGHRGKGGLDIFKASLIDGEFSNLEHLEEPINSKADDFGLIINSATEKGYFTSNRKGGIGDVDIYAFESYIPECFQNLSATFVNSETASPIRNVTLSVIDDSGELLNSIFVSELSATALPLKCESELLIKIEKEGYKTIETVLRTGADYDETIEKEFQLDAIPCTQFIAGSVLHKVELLPLSEVKLSLYAGDSLVKEQLLASDSNFNFEVPCGQTYTLMASKNGFETGSVPIQTGNGFQETLSENILLDPRICRQELQVSVFDAATAVDLSKFKARLLKNGQPVVSKNIINGNQSNFQLECNSSYTVEIEKTGYELSTFAIETNNSYDVFHEKTIRLQALSCVQYLKLEGTSETDREALLGAQIELFQNETYQDLIPFSSLIEIPCNSAISLKISAPGFEPKSIELSTTNEMDRLYEMRVSFIPDICEQELTITVADRSTKTGLTNVEIIPLGNSNMEIIHIKNGNQAHFKIRCNTSTSFRIHKENYEIVEITVRAGDTRGTELSETVFLTPSTCEQLITGQIRDAQSGQALSKALVTISSGNNFSQELALDSDGYFSFTAECLKTYKLSAALVNYGKNELIITTTNNPASSIQKNLTLEKEPEFKSIAGQRLVNTNNIVFELNKTDINVETAVELNKVVALLQKYPDLNLTVKSHTDSRAPDDLNLKLTEERADAIREYLISKGIQASRITAKGMGETELLNNCSNGVKCTDEEHRKNRRTEFIVTN